MGGSGTGNAVCYYSQCCVPGISTWTEQNKRGRDHKMTSFLRKQVTPDSLAEPRLLKAGEVGSRPCPNLHGHLHTCSAWTGRSHTAPGCPQQQRQRNKGAQWEEEGQCDGQFGDISLVLPSR